MPKVIRWTHIEQQQVAAQAAKLRIERVYSELECWRHAQTLLPSNRQRNLITVSLVPTEARELYRKRLFDLQRGIPKEEAALQVDPVAPVKLSTIDDLIENLADVIADKMADAIKRSLVRTLREIDPEYLRRIKEQVTTEQRQPKRPILIVGLLPGQADTITKRYRDRLDLRFVSSQESAQQISARLGNSEKVLLMTNFINHSHQNAALQLKGRDNVVLVSGGISSLAKQLELL